MSSKPFTGMTDTSPEAILAAVKTINSKYFGDYSLSSEEIDAVAVLVAAALELNTARKVADAAYTAGKAEGLREAVNLLDQQHRRYMTAKGRNPDNYTSYLSTASRLILALIPTDTPLTGK
jgi:hypothetical protein